MDRFGLVLVCSYIGSVLAVCVGGLFAYSRNLKWTVLTLAMLQMMLGASALCFELFVYPRSMDLDILSPYAPFWAFPVLLALGLSLLAATLSKEPPRMRDCVKCGYDLRGQEAPRCPECSTPIEEKQWRWLVARRDAEYKVLRQDK